MEEDGRGLEWMEEERIGMGGFSVIFLALYSHFFCVGVLV